MFATVAGFGSLISDHFCPVSNDSMSMNCTFQIPELPDHLSDEAKDFLDGCFQRDPIRRPEARLMENHDFLSDSEVS